MFGSIDRAVRLAGETLEYVRERPQPKKQQVDLADLAEEVGVALVDQGQERDPNLDRDWRNLILAGETVTADRDQLYRVLINLGRNAFDAGAHTVTVSSRREDGLVTIDVADDGPGVPAHLEATLFQPFSGSANASGSGLGLAIARDLVRAHGGEITLAENGSRGARFHLTLPQPVAPHH